MFAPYPQKSPKMAGISKRGKYWRAQIRREGVPTLSRSFDTKAEAEEWAADHEKSVRRGTFSGRLEAERTTLKEALERYLAEVTPLKRGAEQEKSKVKTLVSEKIATMPLALIRSIDVAKYRDSRLKDGKATATVRRELALLRHLFNHARREWGMEGLINPVGGVRQPGAQGDNERHRRVSDEEIKAICAASESATLPLVLHFAVATAMRRSEISGLCFEHINGRVAHLALTKNGDSRDVPLSKRARAVVRLAGWKKEKYGSVFRMQAMSLSHAFVRALRRAQVAYGDNCNKQGIRPDPNFLADLRFHDLRHEATTRLAEKLQMHQLMRVTGHKEPRMLSRYYHPKAEDLADLLG